ANRIPPPAAGAGARSNPCRSPPTALRADRPASRLPSSAQPCAELPRLLHALSPPLSAPLPGAPSPHWDLPAEEQQRAAWHPAPEPSPHQRAERKYRQEHPMRVE